MITAFILAAAMWVSQDSYCHTQLAEGVWTDCVTKIGEETYSDEYTSFPVSIWQYNGVVWAGNPYCVDLGMMPTNPEAFDKGACQPRQLLKAIEPSAPEMMEVK